MSLRQLNVRNFAIIKNLEVEFQEGLTVVTGETGAGKSIVIQALNLLLGSRAEADMIRHGENQCEITADFDVSDLSNVQAWLENKDLIESGDNSNGQSAECLIRRIIRRDKPTKCYINDQPSTLASLRELGLLLVDLHGQHEHQSLLRSATQRHIIDQFADHQAELTKMATLAAKINRLTTELKNIEDGNTDNANHLELLNFQLHELAEAQLQDNEFNELTETQSRLAHAQQLSDGIEQVVDQLFNNDSGNVVTNLGNQIKLLEDLSDFDSDIKSSLELLNSALSEIDEAQSELNANLAKIEHNPERLQEVEQRLDTYINLARKHRCNESELGDRQQALQTEFERLQSLHEQPERLQAQLEALSRDYLQIATRVSEKRTTIASKLSKQISEQMQGLGMQGGHLEIKIDPQGADKISETGIDHISYLVSTNQGMPAKPLQKTASGGELSRISLAIQVITSAHSSTPSLIFDEVDVGVGGSIAAIIGSRMRQLGRQAQVICITHLAQVAAQGHHHLAVSKQNDDDETYSTLFNLEGDDRTAEIARMLGGAEITERTLAHAKEMLAQPDSALKAAS